MHVEVILLQHLCETHCLINSRYGVRKLGEQVIYSFRATNFIIFNIRINFLCLETPKISICTQLATYIINTTELFQRCFNMS